MNDPAREEAHDRPRPRDRGQHARRSSPPSSSGVRALEDGDRDRATSPPTDAATRRLPSRIASESSCHVCEQARPTPVVTAPARRARRGPRRHAAEPERRARPVLHAQPRDPDGQRRPHRRGRGARRREDPPDARRRARRWSSASPSATTTRCSTRCATRSPTATAAGAATQTFDLRIDHPRGHGGGVRAARPAGPAPGRARRGAARRRPAARRGADARLSVLRRRPHARPTCRTAANRTPTTTGSACATRRRMTPEAIVRLAEAAHAALRLQRLQAQGRRAARRGGGRGDPRAARALPAGARHARPERRLAARRTRSACAATCTA